MVFFFLVALVAVLAASTTFFAAKTYKTSRSEVQPSGTLKATIGATDSNDGATTTQPTAAASSAVTRAAGANEKPSKPADTYTVQKGETLFAIAQSQGSNWQDIAEANGISDVNKIQAGKVLVIPKDGQLSFTVDATRSSALQKDADAGKYEFRLSPVESARSDAPSYYGLTVSDNYVLKSSDNGNAQVQATHEDKNYLIKLTQPVTKGDKGIWAIESIRPV